MTIWSSRIERVGEDGVPCNLDGLGDRRTLLLEGASVHRELRPLIGPVYIDEIERILAEGAWLTQLVAEGQVRAIALWRVFHTTYCGRRFEIDDLVTAATARSQGYGATMMRWLEARAVSLGCQTVTLNSAMRRLEAHRFYDREGYRKFGFHFSKELGDAAPLTPA